MAKKTNLLISAEGALKAAEEAMKVADAQATRTSGPGYGASIAPAIASLATMNIQLNKMLLPPPAGLPPVALTTPPFKVSIASVNIAITAGGVVSTAIASTTGLSVAASGAPLEPGFSLGVDSVVTSLDALIKSIDKLLVKTQKP
tara:strand:+ start:196 stop:630 length:435 start_codon:yes stop_codon:yes gene_type:complete